MEGDEQNDSQSQFSLTEGDSEVLSSDEGGEIWWKRQKLDKSMKSKKKSKRKQKQLGTEPEPASLLEDKELALHQYWNHEDFVHYVLYDYKNFDLK